LAITGSAWGALAGFIGDGITGYGRPVFYAIGGLGPTIAAYLAVLATRDEAPLSEFHTRLLRWRVSAAWYAFAFGLPVLVAAASAAAAAYADPGYLASLHLRPWYAAFPLFFIMVLGGGLEELGWRGVAQPEAERCLPPLFAALFVGLIWAAWHLPLFFIAGTSQYGMNFPVFAFAVIGGALLLAWLYDRTRSILLCMIYHASWNTALAMGIAGSRDADLRSIVAGCVSLVLGAVLLLAAPSRER
jgi:membrane protease YdiL (CAAX protease family)